MDGVTWRPWTLSLTTAQWMLTSWPGPCQTCWTCPSLAWWPPSWRTARRPWPPLTLSARPPSLTSLKRPPEAARMSVTQSTRLASRTAGLASFAAGEILDWEAGFSLVFLCLGSTAEASSALKPGTATSPGSARWRTSSCSASTRGLTSRWVKESYGVWLFWVYYLSDLLRWLMRISPII